MNMKKNELSYGNYVISSHVKGIDDLTNVYDALRSFPHTFFSKLLQRIHEFKSIGKPLGTREDWFLVSEFSFDEGDVAVFFPWKSNVGEKRSVSVRTELGVKEDHVRYTVKEVLDILWWEYFSRSHHDPRRVLPEKIFGRILKNGDKIVPRWYVDVRAYLYPVAGGDMMASHLAAKEYFNSRGWEVAW